MARSTSTALAAQIPSVRAISKSAAARSVLFLTAVDATAMGREAVFARAASSGIADTGGSVAVGVADPAFVSSAAVDSAVDSTVFTASDYKGLM